MSLCACGCGEEVKPGNRYINHHHKRKFWPEGHRFEGKIQNDQGYILIKRKGHHRANSDGYVREHILICENAIGKPLPSKAEIHHIDGNKQNNDKSNLVVCDSHEYHRLLHVRQNALNECGDPNKFKCYLCKEYDYSDNMIKKSGKKGRYKYTFMHKKCRNLLGEYYRNIKKYGAQNEI